MSVRVERYDMQCPLATDRTSPGGLGVVMGRRARGREALVRDGRGGRGLRGYSERSLWWLGAKAGVPVERGCLAVR